jgi:DNA-directed RNA polymerase specialized sigma24 family protein
VIEGGGGSKHAGVTAERAIDGAAPAPLVERDARRDQILSDPAIHKEIRKVARIRNVPASEIDDVLQDVLKDACVDPGLPLEDRDAARRYLGVCARNKSVDRERARRRRRARFVAADDEMAAPGALSMEDRAMAWKLFKESKERFPRTHAWFERFALEGESDAAIAQEASVSPSRVRAAVSEVRLWLRGYGVVTATAVVILLLGLRLLRLPGGHRVDHSGDIAHSASAQPPAPPVAPPVAPSAQSVDVREALDLRDLARHEADIGQWDRAFVHLARANELDPQGETPELQDLLQKASDKIETLHAKPRRRH